MVKKLRDRIHTETSASATPTELHCPSTLIAFYLDDGIIIVPHPIIRICSKFLQSTEVEQYVLRLNERKTSPTARDDSLEWAKTKWSEGTEVFGSPVGSPRYQRTMMNGLAKRKGETLQKLNDLNDAHSILTLLRVSLGASQINYHLRTIPPRDTKSAAETYDNQVRKILRSIAGGRLPNETLQELFLSLKVENVNTVHFNIGRTSAFHSRNAAYLSSRTATASAIKSLTHEIPTKPDPNDQILTHLDPRSKHALADYCDQIGTTEAAKLRSTSTWDDWRGPTTQKDLLSLVNKERIAGIKPTNE